MGNARDDNCLAAALFLTAGCAATTAAAKDDKAPQEAKQAQAPAKEDAGAVDNSKLLSSKDYEARVKALGGRVDFVFGKDRPFSQCHASTVVRTSQGTLMTAWFGGTEEKNPDVSIWLSRFVNGTWSAPIRVARAQDCAHWNPVLFTVPDSGETHLFFKVGPEIPYWQTYWMSTTDNGLTWTAPKELVPGDKGGRGPVKNKPIILSDGSWLAPASTELGGWKPFADRSTDRGTTWTRSADFQRDKSVLPGVGAIQPTFWESPKGWVHALLRTAGGKVWRADSKDFGQTWGPVYATPLPNNDSGIDLLRYDDGRLYLVYNPVAKNWGPRTPLDLAVSRDDGETWTTVAHLEDDPNLDSEYSYPAIVRTREGIAVCYTYNRDTVRCWQIPAAALE
jgi:predicted neuraminidase